MPLNQSEASFLKEKNKNRIILKDIDLDQARKHFTNSMKKYHKKQDLFHVFDCHIFRNSRIPLRIYQPSEDKMDVPIILYLHGGGFVLGSIDAYDHDCRRLAFITNCIVVSVEYRLAPEFPFPAAIEDCYTAFEWILSNSAIIGGNLKKLIVMGDSAGGNLATNLCFRLNSFQRSMVKLQVLIYPCIDFTCASASHQKFSQGYNVTSETLLWCYSQYVGDMDQNLSFHPSFLTYDSCFFHDFPNSLIIAAEYDALSDEAEKFFFLLKKYGIKSEFKKFPGTIHGFLSYYDLFFSSKNAFEFISDYIKDQVDCRF